jgi:hypothetical protein
LSEVKLKLIATVLFLVSYETLAAEVQNEKEAAKEKNYYVEAKSYSTTPESDVPKYVRQLDKTGIDAFKNINWIDAGLQYRVRFEDRKNDFRRLVDVEDAPVLSRTRAYFAIKDIIDPLRFSIELQDSRKAHSKFPQDGSDVNKLDFIQAYAELHFKDVFGSKRPVSVRAGRMSFEVLDRRLVARNEWRNTSNSFQGFRTIIGKNENDWQIDSFALQPLQILSEETDHRINGQWFYGSILNWRRWSDIITLQPFYFRLDQNQTKTLTKKNVNSPGIRAYGLIGKTNFDYDLIGVYQFGQNGTQSNHAYGYVAEIGYSFDHKFKPRLSVNYGYGSGDQNPTDNQNQRFEKFFGFGRPWSSSDYLQWENIESLKARIELKPTKLLKFDAGYSSYKLASSTDRWNKANLRDKKGLSGDSIGNEIDSRIIYKITPNLEGNIGYSHFTPGRFTKEVGRDKPSDFVYLELTWSLFK